MKSALAEKIKSGRAQRFAAKSQKRKANVIKLAPRQGKKKLRQLTQPERENLVVEFRIKARKLGRSILRKWQSRLDLQEVDSIVDLSLCEAVRRFDPNKGASFITFLYYHLRGNLIRAITAAASQNAVPTFDPEMLQAGDDGRMPNSIEVAAALTQGDSRLPDEILYQKEIVSLSAGACATLDPLEREVIERIYLNEEQLIDIANSLGYSRCHISRVKKKALETLHAELKGKVGAEIAGNGPIDDEVITVRTRKTVRRRKAAAVPELTETLAEVA